MKTCCLTIFLLSYFITEAQLRFPAGVANTYTLNEKDGYSNFMYLPVTITADGTIYTATYNGNVEIHGNNYTVQLDSLKKLHGFVNDCKVIDNNEVWVFGLKYIVVLKNKKISKTIKLPENISGYIKNVNPKSMYFFSVIPKATETWVFNGQELIKLAVSSFTFNTSEGAILETFDKQAFAIKKLNDSLLIYKFDNKLNTFTFKKSYKNIAWIWCIKDENNFIAGINNNGKNVGGRVKNGTINGSFENINTGTDNSYNFYTTFPKEALYKSFGSKFFAVKIDSNLNLKLETPFTCNDDINALSQNLSGHFYYGHTGNRLIIITPYLKKYAALFNHSNTAAVFTLREDSMGRIWAGSYQTGIGIINKGVVTEVKNNQFKMMNGGSYFNGRMYLIGEGNGGLLQYDMKGNVRKVSTASTGFYTYISKNKKHFYYTTANKLGLWQTTAVSLETLHPVWNKIDSSKGNKINNILTITEDTVGRIWCGHSRSGIAVYDPATDKAKTWLTEKKETVFGGFSSLTDKWGTVWIGSGKGLWYYNDYSKAPGPENCRQIDHPLLNTGKLITALTVYDKWLVIAAYDKVLLLDLKRFHETKKITLRYLNHYEAAFTSFTEQNTMLTAKDSSIWFSTSDMLYQWDIKNWLALQTYKVKETVIVTGSNKETVLKQNNTVSFKPSFNSFDILVHYVSPDNMPRYTRAAFIKEGDTVLLPEPGLQSSYSVKNIAAGNYNFILEIFEMDGSTTRYVYPITIKKYLWQLWWFWALLSIMITGAILYLFTLKQKKRVAEEKAKTKEAELQSFKNEQEKKLANLQLVTLSSQFRPHFILNALNTIGAQMDDKPEAESVLSRLGESVNLIFNHAQQQKILHQFNNEWKLVQNIIHIHRQMYLKQLVTILPDASITAACKNIHMPLGILQIPVENALLHGLSNRENGPWNLSIAISEKENHIVVHITDNGVGRKKSATLSNFTKHGTGTKNLSEIVTIINAANTEKISITYTDDIYSDAGNKYGTGVRIEIPKQLNYGNY